MKLITYYEALGEPTASPFCVKAMCLLQMSGQEWAPEFTNDPRKGPKGKLPVLDDNGTQIPDSDAIRAHLETKYDVDFDAGLSAEQRAVSRAVIRMMEEHYYFAGVCNRWLNDENWAVVKDLFFKGIPAPLNGFITRKIRSGVRNGMFAQGMGRHSVEEQLARTNYDVEAVKTLLGDKPFLFGDTPTAADASVVPMFRATVGSPAKTDFHNRIADDPVLMAYIERGKDAMYPSY